MADQFLILISSTGNDGRENINVMDQEVLESSSN